MAIVCMYYELDSKSHLWIVKVFYHFLYMTNWSRDTWFLFNQSRSREQYIYSELDIYVVAHCDLRE